MKFLIDAQLSPVIANFLKEKGFDAIHTYWLPEGNNTSDAEINRISIAESRIVITKDSDFYHSHILKGEPYKLVFIRVGNIGVRDLKELFARNLPTILSFLGEGRIIELTKTEVRILF